MGALDWNKFGSKQSIKKRYFSYMTKISFVLDPFFFNNEIKMNGD